MKNQAKSFISMKKLSSLLLALLMMLSALSLTPAPLKAEEPKVTNLFGSTLADLQGYINTMTLVGDTLYIMTTDGLYTFAPGDQRAVKAAAINSPHTNYAVAQEGEEGEPFIWSIYSDGQNLLGLDTQKQSLYTLTIDGDKVAYTNPVKLDLSDFVRGEPPYESVSSPQWAQVLDGKLYMKMHNYESLETDLYSFDIITGEKKAHEALHIQYAAAYKDGKLIVVQQDPNNRYDMEAGGMIPPPLFVYDPADDSLTSLDASLITNEMSGDVYPFYYDAAEGSLYTYTDTDVIRMDGDFKQQRLVGYLPMFGTYFSTANGIWPLGDGRLAIAAGQNVFLRERTEKGLEGYTVLSMSGGSDDPSILSRTLMEMDNVVIRKVEGVQYNYINAEQLASMFLTGSVNVDIMSINVNGFDLDKLIEKGYLADLSSGAGIKDYMTTFAPNLKKAFVLEDKIYAVPNSLMLVPAHASTKAFEEIGQDIPTNLVDLVGLTEEWMLGLMEDHPEYNLFSDSSNIKSTITWLAIEKYIANKLGAGEDLVFDTPVFRSLMERIASIDFGDFASDPDWENPEAMSSMEEYWNKTSILEVNMGYEPRYATRRNLGRQDMVPLVFAIEDGQTAYQDADLSLFVVMSSSKNIDTAIKFLDKMIDKLDPVDKAAFNLDAKDAIPNPNFERDLEGAEKNLKQYEDMLAKAEGAEKSNLEEGLKYMREYVENMRKDGMYLATSEDLDNMHHMISHLYVNTGLDNAQWRTYRDSHELREQYNQGVISLDQFIKQLDDKLRLVRMEYN